MAQVFKHSGYICLFFIAFAGNLILPAPGFSDESKITNSLGMTFVRILPGTFTMGSPETERWRNRDEMPHKVTIKEAFYIQNTEVTLQQWRAVMGKNWLSRRKGSPDTPVTRVSWHDCIRYIRKLNELDKRNYRLPTEAEWEYACRAGTRTVFSFGDHVDCSKAAFGNSPLKDDQCISCFTARNLPTGSPVPVKSFPPNPWGIFDMHGNVWEWCEDLYAPYLSGASDTGYSGIQSDSRVRRGGSFYNHGGFLRSANRTYAHPDSKFKTTGFRLVLKAAE